MFLPGELICLSYDAELRAEPKYFDNNETKNAIIVTAEVPDGTTCLVLAALSDAVTQPDQISRGCTWYLLLSPTGIGWDFFINKHVENTAKVF